MLKSVLELHEQRVAAYRELDAAFRQFLLDEQEKIFGLATARATQEFVRISTAILEVQKNADGEAADLIKVRELVGRRCRVSDGLDLCSDCRRRSRRSWR